MDYRDNPQHRVLLHRVAGVYAATVVYFYSGEWRVFTPALTGAISAKEIIEKNMSSTQLETAERLARECFNNNFKRC